MEKPQAVRSDSLLEALASSGITRHIAFKAENCQVLRSRSAPGVISSWHHHGDYDVYGYVVSGSGRFESGHGTEYAIIVSAGDFFHVPPHTIHREINPSRDEGNEFILFLHGSGQMVYNLENSE